ncbi:SLC15A1, partial [Cordylochernes scorpioides]
MMKYPEEQIDNKGLGDFPKKIKEDFQNDKPYPKGMYFVLANEFFERGAFYGVRNIMTLYFTVHLLYTEEASTEIYHGFSFINTLVPIFSAILADSWLGKYKIIVITTIIFIIGNIVLTVSPVEFDAKMALFGIFLIAVGSGGVKPNIAAFGGDLFDPDQERKLQKFFSFFYISVNVGSMVFSFVTPILKDNFRCFNDLTCYPLAFGLSCICIALSLLSFLVGTPFYKTMPSPQNMFVRVVSCICSAISGKIRATAIVRKNHWLDYADSKYSQELINDVKGLLNVLKVFMPIPFYWALYDQQGSSWTIQSKAMDGQITSFWRISPDQFQVINPLLVIILIPLSDYIIYPFFVKFNFLVKPLHKMVAGGFLTAISFLLAAMVQVWIDSSLTPIPQNGMVKLSIINGLDCEFSIIMRNQSYVLDPLSSKTWFNISKGSNFNMIVAANNRCQRIPLAKLTYKFTANKHIIAFITLKDNQTDIQEFKDQVGKPVSNNGLMFLAPEDKMDHLHIQGPTPSLNKTFGIYQEALPGIYTFSIDNINTSISLEMGGRYIVAVSLSTKKSTIIVPHVVVKPNKIHMTWQIFQYVVLTFGKPGLFRRSKYPQGMYFILINEFFERAAFFSVKNLMMIFLTTHLLFSRKKAMDIYHGFTVTTTLVPLISAILADSWLGKYLTVMITTCIFLTGSLVLTLSPIHPDRNLALTGTFLISIGSGGIRSIICAIGGDLFNPDQKHQLQRFFSFFYLFSNMAAILFLIITPMLKDYNQCFQAVTCYPLAFGVCTISITLSLVIFLAGTQYYNIVPPLGNMFIKVVSCICSAIYGMYKASKNEKRGSWLEYADKKYSEQLINDVRALLNVLKLYIPLPLYWALYDQQGSSWAMQAKSMDGEITPYWHVAPEQIHAINPLLVIIMIPLADYSLYPFFAKHKLLIKPLHKMVVGGFLTASSFILAGFVQITIDSTLSPTPESGMVKLTVINGLDCSFRFLFNENDNRIAPFASKMWYEVPIGSTHNVIFMADECIDAYQVRKTYEYLAKEDAIVFITFRKNNVVVDQFNDTVEKPIRQSDAMILNPENSDLNLHIAGPIPMDVNKINQYQPVLPGIYRIRVNNISTNVNLRGGGRYVLAVSYYEPNFPKMILHTVVEPNKVPMALMLFQYIALVLGEVLFAVTGLQFAYTEASPRMKSVLQGFWILNISLGNVIVLLINQFKMGSLVVDYF